jgi:hypothetical protein
LEGGKAIEEDIVARAFEFPWFDQTFGKPLEALG